MKKRLDILVSEITGETRSKSQAIIMAGQIFVDNKIIDKPGALVDESLDIKIKSLFPYVSRGALKLKGAQEKFKINFKDKIVCDIGASTGGFTDCALQNGAKKVYAIDVGYGQLAQKIREDERVVVMEKTNIKNVASLPEPVDIFVIDVSFISLKKVLPQIQLIIQNSKLETRKSSEVIALVKPQFEVGKKIADKFRGVITDPKIQEGVLEDIKEFAQNLGYTIEDETESPIKGAKGNREFLLYIKVNPKTQITSNK